MLYEGCCENALENSFIITLIQTIFEMTKLLGRKSIFGH